MLRTADFGGVIRSGFQEMTWEGDVSWEFELPLFHHDIEPMPNGNVLMIVYDLLTATEAVDIGRNPDLLGSIEDFNYPLTEDDKAVIPDGAFLLSEKIVEVEKTGPAEGTIVWEWKLSDHLIQDFDNARKNYGVVADHPELVNVNFQGTSRSLYGQKCPDWIHVNSIDYHPDLDQILITACHFGEVWIIDHSTSTEEAASHTGGKYGIGGDLLYRWGNPLAYNRGALADQHLFMQHNGKWIHAGLPGTGNILIFDNGLLRDSRISPEVSYSSVIEITPPLNIDGSYHQPDTSDSFEPVSPAWLYAPDPPTDFYAIFTSSAQRLPNGNTLVCLGNRNIFRELTPQGEVVWEYINPDRVEDAPSFFVFWAPLVYECQRYASNYPGLAGKDLTPKGTIEEYEVMSNLTLESSIGGKASFPYGAISTYGEGQVATISAEPDPEYQFDKWRIISGDIDINNTNQAWTTFKMGNRDSVVRANFSPASESNNILSTKWIIVIVALAAVFASGLAGFIWWKAVKQRR